MANNFLTFCPTDTGTNLLTQGDYAVAADRTIGNQPGVASSQLVNKALRQSAFMSSQLAEYASFKTGADTLDNGVTAQMLSILKCAFLPLSPEITTYPSGSGNYNATFQFFIASGSATAAATYTNNGNTYTVKETVAAGLIVKMTGNAAPTVSGTLTKSAGTGDATLTFYAVRAPISLNVRLCGGGGGGGSGGGTSSAGANGTDSTFGPLTAGGGSGGAGSTTGGAGGSSSLGSGPLGFAINGNSGSPGACNIGTASFTPSGGNGGASYFGGAGAGGASGGGGSSAVTNSGAGGGGGSGNAASGPAAGGGGAGGFVDATITGSSLLYTYAYSIGGGGAGAGGSTTGGTGGSGFGVAIEAYQ